MPKSGLSVIMMCINMLLLVFGLLTSTFGALVLWSEQAVYFLLANPIDYLKHHVDPTNTNFGFSAVKVFMEMSKPFSEVIFIFGIITVCVSLIGIWSLTKNKLCSIVFYLFILGLVLMAHTGSIIYYFSHQDLVVNYADQVLFKLVGQYTSLSSGASTSLPFAMIMINLGCCGYEDGNDFQKSYNFRKTEKFDGVLYKDLPYPIACCKLRHNLRTFNSNCPREFTPFTSNVDIGCKELFMDKALTLVNMSVYISLIIMLLNIIIIALLLIKIMELVNNSFLATQNFTNKSNGSCKNHNGCKANSNKPNDHQKNDECGHE